MAEKTNILMGKDKQPQIPEVKRVAGRDIAPHSIRQYHIYSDLFLIKVGLEADRPVTGNEFRFWFSTDTFVMSYWDSENEVWKESAPFS